MKSISVRDFSIDLNNLAHFIDVPTKAQFALLSQRNSEGIYCIEATKDSLFQNLAKIAQFSHHNVHKVFFLPKELEHIKYSLLDCGATDVFVEPYDVRLVNCKLKTLCYFIASQLSKSDVLEFSQMKVIPAKMQIDLEGLEGDTRSLLMTPTQFRIFYFLAKQPDTIRTRKEIMENTFGYGNHVMERNIDTHISKIRKLLGSQKNSIISAHGRGYKFSDL